MLRLRYGAHRRRFLGAAATGGWGFAQFNDGKPADEAMHNACFTCHEIAKARDVDFNRYAP